jgi:hypothetical protein
MTVRFKNKYNDNIKKELKEEVLTEKKRKDFRIKGTNKHTEA